MKSVLPADPADLIELAVRDYRNVTKRPGVHAEMAEWLYVGPHHCTVCLAGAVMFERLDWRNLPDPSIGPEDLVSNKRCSLRDAHGLEALNSFRAGCYRAGLYFISSKSRLLGQNRYGPEVTAAADAWIAEIKTRPDPARSGPTPYWEDTDAFTAWLEHLVASWRRVPEDLRDQYHKVAQLNWAEEDEDDDE